MIVSWNVRGLNKIVKIKEVSPLLLNLNPVMVVINETCVKEDMAAKIRDNLKIKGMFMDNYLNHDNGRIWIWWNNNKVEMNKVASSVQYIHCGIYDMCGNFILWFNRDYGLNQLDHGRKLWMDIEQLHLSQ